MYVFVTEWAENAIECASEQQRSFILLLAGRSDDSEYFHYDCARKAQTCTAHSLGGLFLLFFFSFGSPLFFPTCFLLVDSLFYYKWCSWKGNVDLAFHEKFYFGRKKDWRTKEVINWKWKKWLTASLLTRQNATEYNSNFFGASAVKLGYNEDKQGNFSPRIISPKRIFPSVMKVGLELSGKQYLVLFFFYVKKECF